MCALVLSFLGEVGPLCAEPSVHEVLGIVRSQTGGSLQSQPVTLESSAGAVIEQQTLDSDGRFEFSSLDAGVYYVAIRAPGYRALRERVDLTTARRVSLQLKLQREGPAQSEPPQAAISARLLGLPAPALKNYQRGLRLVMVEKKAQASLRYFQSAIRAHPDFPEARFMLGLAYMDLRRFAEAQAALEKAMELDEKYAAAHLALGSCLNAQGNYRAAEKPLLRGLEVQPNAATGHWELGRVYWTMQRWADAEVHVRKAVELAPTLAPARVLMGNVLLQKRDAAGALEQFREYLRLEPRGPMAGAAREAVNQLSLIYARNQ